MTILFIFPFICFKINLCSCGCVYLILGFTLLGHTIHGYTSLIKMSNQAKWDPPISPITVGQTPSPISFMFYCFVSQRLILLLLSQEPPSLFFIFFILLHFIFKTSSKEIKELKTFIIFKLSYNT